MNLSKVMFTLQFHSVLDVITNSSSELFVGLHKSKKLMINLVKDIYPEYLSEYEDIKTFSELSSDELDLYINYHYESRSNNEQRIIRDIPDGFLFDEMYVRESYGSNDREYIFIRDDFVTKYRDRLIESIDPDGKMFFMFSLDENPNWDMQKSLESIMTRYHLG